MRHWLSGLKTFGDIVDIETDDTDTMQRHGSLAIGSAETNRRKNNSFSGIIHSKPCAYICAVVTAA